MPDHHNSQEYLKARILDLEKENKILTEFADLSSDWFWEQDTEFRFTRFFGMSTQKLRRDQQLFIGQLRWEMPIHGLTPEELSTHIECCEQHKPFHDFEYEVPGNDNQLQRYVISGSPLFDQDGTFTGYHGVGRNITELRTAQNAVAKSQRQLFQILQGSPIPTFVIDQSHTVTHWNKACEMLTGLSSAEVINQQNSWRGFYLEPRPTLADLVVENVPLMTVKKHYGNKLALSTLINGAYGAEDFFPNMGSSGLWLNFNASPLLDTQGNIIGAIETLQNVTDRVLAEQTERKHYVELQQAHIELQDTIQQLVEAKKLAGFGRLVSGIAHELNTPLGNILLSLSSSQQLLSELTSNFNQSTLSKRQMTEFIKEATESQTLMSENLNRCINLIQRFKELRSDQELSSPAIFHPSEAINDVFILVEHECAKRNISLRNNIAPELSMTNDQGVFEQIAFSLLENSLIHGLMDAGEFIVNSSITNKELIITFADNGSGMDEKALSQAFDPFFSSQMGQGTSGLGLYRVFNLVTAVLGGKVSIHNLDPGLMVSLSLPHEKKA